MLTANMVQNMRNNRKFIITYQKYVLLFVFALIALPAFHISSI